MGKKGGIKKKVRSKGRSSKSSKSNLTLYVGILMLPCLFFWGLNNCVTHKTEGTLSAADTLEQVTALQKEKLVLDGKIKETNQLLKSLAVKNMAGTTPSVAIEKVTATAGTAGSSQTVHSSFKDKLSSMFGKSAWHGFINHAELGKSAYTLKVNLTPAV
jgi:hypothetical protein